MKPKIQLLFASVLVVFAGIVTSSCDHDDDYWSLDSEKVLTDASHGSLKNGQVVATGDVKNITHNSATILFSANYNYKKSLDIKPVIIYSEYYNTSYSSTNRLEINSTNTYHIDVENFNSSACEVTLTNLKPSTKYYYRVYADKNESRFVDHYGEVKSFTTSAAPVDYSTGEAVDLGLSIKWASKNIGATLPEDKGVTFYWGGTSPTQQTYYADWHDYILSTLKNRGYVDSDNNLTSTYDAATQRWGSKWRMPTREECQELVNQCTWKLTTRNGQSVYLITGPNSNVIYLPASVYYWTATSYSGTSSSYAYRSYYWNNYGASTGNRENIYYIRPVSK